MMERIMEKMIVRLEMIMEEDNCEHEDGPGESPNLAVKPAT